ncbi:MAG: ROK family protein [Candidatus Marinimicrobia bacterium]|nr:ROK family protein [Candidatus Neomarinimicrobiota bacterium]MCF7880270.1 ROK family protein [Candidatus Neomarinimicrobiota bacterium]
MVRIGADVGGTKVAIGLVDESNSIISEIVRFPVKQFQDGDGLVSQMVIEAKALLNAEGFTEQNVTGFGVGAPGPMDLETGTIRNTPNTPILVNYALRDSIREKSGFPTELNNDANCFVLGEALAGEARHGEYVVGVTLGTGYGCGIVLNKQLHTGATGTAAEIAMCPYRDSTLESHISGRGLSWAYKKRAGKEAEGKAIARLAATGDEEALGAFEEFGEHIGRSFAWFINLLDPDYIVIGGSIAQNWDYFYPTLKATMDQYINPNPKAHMKIVQSQLGESAAIIGAAGLITST